MTTSGVEIKTLVFTHRLKMRAVVETMSEQVPEVRMAFSEIEEMLQKRLQPLTGEGWQIISHSHNIYNGILIISVLISR